MSDERPPADSAAESAADSKAGGRSVPAESARSPAPRRRLPRFGVGAVMVLMTVLAFQYALINYFGPVAAMAIPPVICGGMIVVVIGAEIAASRSPASRARQWSRRNFSWAVGYIFLLGISAYLTGGAQIGYQWFSQWRLERRLQKDLGFRYTKAYVWGADRQSRQAIVLLLVEPGRPLDQAGLIAGETLITELSPAEWFRMVEENRGRQIQVRVAQGALGRALEKCPQRTVELRIPP